MLKPYDKPDDIPEPLREHYSRREDGKYHADIPNDHPAVKHNATLLSEKQAAEEKMRTAEANLESAKASGLPRGHVAVPSAKAALLEQYEPLGTPDELKTIKAEHGDLKGKVATQERKAHLENVRKEMGWGDSSVAVLEMIQDLPELEIRDSSEKDAEGKPKKTVVAKVKGADNVVTEKPFADYFSDKHAALLPSVQVVNQPTGTVLPPHGAGGGSTGEDLITQRNKARDEARKTTTNPLMPPKAVAA